MIKVKPFAGCTWVIVKAVAVVTVLLINLGYVYVFLEYIEMDIWEHVLGFTRIILPDTLLYSHLVDKDDLFQSIFFSSYKNAIFPSAMWYLAGFNWYVVAIINAFFLWLIICYIEKISKFYEIKKSHMQWGIILYTFLPTNIYYSIGSLKELPGALFLLMFVYYFNKKSWQAVLLSTIMLVVIRYQIIVILLITFILNKGLKKGLLHMVILLILAAALFPLISKFDILNNTATEIYRAGSDRVGTIGQFVEEIRDGYWGISIVAIIVRIVQSMFEPVIAFVIRGTFYEDEYLSIYNLALALGLVLFTPVILLYCTKLRRAIGCRDNIPKETEFIFMLTTVGIFLTGGFSFVQHRYLYQYFPLIMIAALIGERKLYKYHDTLVRDHAGSIVGAPAQAGLS